MDRSTTLGPGALPLPDATEMIRRRMLAMMSRRRAVAVARNPKPQCTAIGSESTATATATDTADRADQDFLRRLREAGL